MRQSGWSVLGVLLLSGCYEGVTHDVGGFGVPPGAASAGGGAQDDDGDDGDDDDAPGASVSCDDGQLHVGRSAMRRLSNAEYNATIADLLGDTSSPANAFLADEEREGFPNNSSLPDSLLVEQYQNAAGQLAAYAAEARFGEWIDCDVADDSCARSFIEDFGQRAFRRPLEATEIDEYHALYTDLRDDAGGTIALTDVVETMLRSPYFLYHVEVGRPDASGPIIALTSWEVASRLSYFLWGTMPDASLMDAAAADELSSPDAVEAHARRMLNDPRAEKNVVEFASHWLGLAPLDEAVRDAELFPEWNDGLREAMRDEAESFVAQTWLGDDARLETLLGASHSYIDDPDLAALYGVQPAQEPGGRVELDPSERGGLLTLGAVLVSNAYPTENSWVHRGKLVRTKMMCTEPPPPPDNITFEDINDPNRVTNPDCAPCHQLMDPIGQAFDAYDPTGRFLGAPIAGEVFASEIGGFESIPDLARQMADDAAVQECLVSQVSRFAFARTLEGEDVCNHERLVEVFEESGFDLRELMVAVVTNDAFVLMNEELEE